MWDPSKHPHRPGGSSQGGEWAPKHFAPGDPGFPRRFPPGVFQPDDPVMFWPVEQGANTLGTRRYHPLWKALAVRDNPEKTLFWFADPMGAPHHEDMLDWAQQTGRLGPYEHTQFLSGFGWQNQYAARSGNDSPAAQVVTKLTSKHGDAIAEAQKTANEQRQAPIPLGLSAAAPSITPEQFTRRVQAGTRMAEVAVTSVLAERYARALRSIAGDVARRFKRQATSLTAAGPREYADEVPEPKFVAPNPQELVPKAALAAAIEKLTREIRAQVVAVTVGGILTEAGIEFDVGGIFARRILDNVGARLRDADLSTRDAIRTVIDRAQQEGWTVPETAGAIKAHITELADSTAIQLARTDLIGTSNASAIAAARIVFAGQQGIVKRWLATEDERTRPTHIDADGQVVPLDSGFTVGTSRLDYPGDPSGPDAEVCNCRCTLLFEEEGLLATAWRGITAAFDPAKHPHEPGGTPVGGRWARKGGYRTARIPADAPELLDLNRRFRDAPEDFFAEDGSPDGALAEIVRLQGYDGLPEVVTDDELAARLPQWDDKGYKVNEGDGSLELWRGVSDDIPPDLRTADDYAEQFRSGPYYIGEGLYGNGTYATTDRDLAAAYTYDSQGLTNPNPRGLIHMALRPDAKIATLEDSDFQRNWKDATYDADGLPKVPLYVDAGRYAAARGYDAMKTPDGNYVIFNRTAVVVAR